MQLGLAHRALEAQEQAVVVGAGVVEAVSIADQRVEERAHLQELVPVPAGPGEAGDLDAQDQADVPKADLGNETLEAGPIDAGGAGAAEILVNDDDLFARPAEPASPISQGLLQARRFAVLLNLTQARLADVDHGLPVAMTRADLLWKQAIRRERSRDHGRPPDRRIGAGERGRSGARSDVGAVPPADRSSA